MLPLVFLDLDGTIIGEDGGVSARLWAALDEARARGLVLAACTGRACQGVAQRIARRLGPDTPHIFHNGALVARASGEVLQSHALEPEHLLRLVAHARKLEETIEFYTADAIYVERNSWPCRHHAEVLDIEVTERDLEDVARNERVLRAHWIVAPERLDAALALDLPGCQVGTASSPALPESLFASITRDGVTKGSAARFVADHLGISPGDAMAIGDSMGDLPVLEVVGHPRVMGDCDEALRARFETLPGIAGDGAAEGIAQAMRRR